MKKIVILLVCAIILAACGGSDSDEPSEVTIFAAASLTDAFEALAIKFEAHNEGVTVRLNFASSSTLAAQIIEGAGADVFASANPQQMQNVADEGKLTSAARNFAGNRLVVAASTQSHIETLEDLTSNAKIVIAAPQVPVRVYTDEALAKMDASGDYGDDFAARVLANVVSEETDVRAVVLKVSLGEADAGFVYRSDISPDIRAIDIPDDYNVLATYPIAATSDNLLAKDFIDFVMSADGQTILVEWGFLSAPE